jgi:hypothetical protein
MVQSSLALLFELHDVSGSGEWTRVRREPLKGCGESLRLRQPDSLLQAWIELLLGNDLQQLLNLLQLRRYDLEQLLKLLLLRVCELLQLIELLRNRLQPLLLTRVR